MAISPTPELVGFGCFKYILGVLLRVEFENQRLDGGIDVPVVIHRSRTLAGPGLPYLPFLNHVQHCYSLCHGPGNLLPIVVDPPPLAPRPAPLDKPNPVSMSQSKRPSVLGAYSFRTFMTNR